MKIRPSSLVCYGWAVSLLFVAGCGESTPDKPTVEQQAPNYGPESAKKLMGVSKELTPPKPGTSVTPGTPASSK